MKKRDRMAAIRHAAVLKRLDQIERQLRRMDTALATLQVQGALREVFPRPPEPLPSAVLRKNRPN